jgi:hypothetical protein
MTTFAMMSPVKLASWRSSSRAHRDSTALTLVSLCDQPLPGQPITLLSTWALCSFDGPSRVKSYLVV